MAVLPVVEVVLLAFLLPELLPVQEQLSYRGQHWKILKPNSVHKELLHWVGDQNNKLHNHKYKDVQADGTEKFRNKTKKEHMTENGINNTKLN